MKFLAEFLKTKSKEPLNVQRRETEGLQESGCPAVLRAVDLRRGVSVQPVVSGPSGGRAQVSAFLCNSAVRMRLPPGDHTLRSEDLGSRGHPKRVVIMSVDSEIRQTWIQIPALPLVSCVTLGMPLNLSVLSPTKQWHISCSLLVRIREMIP